MRLEPGSDFRKPEYRKEIFTRFYMFHLQHRSHPGAVYYLIPYLKKTFNWDDEQTLWFCFINGNTQNPLTSLLIHNAGSRPENYRDNVAFWNENKTRLAWDTDRRYHRTQFDKSLYGYLDLTGGQQTQFWSSLSSWNEAWAAAGMIPTFGRLSSWSYIEYLKIAGFGHEAPTLMLNDWSGSKSHRNGLAIVSGNDHMDWHKSNESWEGPKCYTPKALKSFEDTAYSIIEEVKERAGDASWINDVGRLTLESTLCTYKGWHRPNRRYPNVYNDMLHDRIRTAEKNWPTENWSVFWNARKETLPKHLRLEDNPNDPGLNPIKQNHYRLTGQPVVMFADDPELYSDYDKNVLEGKYGSFR